MTAHFGRFQIELIFMYLQCFYEYLSRNLKNFRDKQYKEINWYFSKKQNIQKSRELGHMPTWRTVVPGSTMTDWPSTNTSIKLLAAVAVVRTDHQKY